ncbi:MAG: UDP-N-acetylmuramate dehydrogenase [Clostridiales bacterium]|nr:UDP-N-acetylmuramate dehydrogenase [Clostridiales bacterium]
MGNDLSAWTTFGIGGKARRIAVANTRGELEEFSSEGLLLGRGSNVLVSDDGYDGTVVINRFESIEKTGALVVVGSGTRLTELCAYLANSGLSGMEWAVGIPASVGGAVRMNAGAEDGAIANRLVYADILRGGKTLRLSADEIGFSYRKSGLLPRDVVLSAAFALDYGDSNKIKALCKQYTARRNARQPKGKSAGSIFKNPSGISVGKVLDDAGLKGMRIGGAQISPKHANIIVNTGGATAHDVCELIAVMRNALTERGVTAEEEIIYIGGF